MLLDTHVLLWFLTDATQLPPSLKHRIENADFVCISIASLWEIAIKLSIGKLELSLSFADLPDILLTLQIEIIHLSFQALSNYITLPLHHRDPFDRILISQAITHSLDIVSADEKFDAYAIRRLWIE